MPINMPFVNKITIDTTKTVIFKRVIAQYGLLAVTQEVVAGINNIQDTWDVKWSYLTQAEAATVESALRSTYGTDYIIWTPCRETKAKHFRIDGGIDKSFNKDNTVQISAKIYQIFDYDFSFVSPTTVDINYLLYPEKLEISTSKGIKLQKSKAAFFNGYSQEVAVGLNSIQDYWKIVWAGLSGTEVIALENSLALTMYNKPLIWKPQGESIQKEFIVTSGYTRDYLSGILGGVGNFRISTDLRENFNL